VPNPVKESKSSYPLDEFAGKPSDARVMRNSSRCELATKIAPPRISYVTPRASSACTTSPAVLASSPEYQSVIDGAVAMRDSPMIAANIKRVAPITMIRRFGSKFSQTERICYKTSLLGCAGFCPRRCLKIDRTALIIG